MMFIASAFFRKFSPAIFLFIVMLVLPAGIAVANPGSGDADQSGNNTSFTRLVNPLKGEVDTIPEFVEVLLNIVLTIGVPIVVLAFIFSGFLFVTAQGNTEKLSQAKQAFLYTFIGAIVLLGAYVLAEAIGGTVEQLTT